MDSLNTAEQDLQRTTNRVCEAMMVEVNGFTSPISKVIDHDYGELEGTGSYVEIDGRRFLVTNEHVAACRSLHSLAHQFADCSNVYRTLHPFVCVTYPNDVALCPIDDSIWSHSLHNARAIPLSRFASCHAPVDGELLFLCGYSGDTSKFTFGQLNSERLQYLTKQDQMPTTHGDPNFHFAVPYRPDLATPTREAVRSRGLPRPPGWSGTLVWNTRYIEKTQAGEDWCASIAQVTGIVWGWPSSDACLLATKAEYLDLLTLKQASDNLK